MDHGSVDGQLLPRLIEAGIQQQEDNARRDAADPGWEAEMQDKQRGQGEKQKEQPRRRVYLGASASPVYPCLFNIFGSAGVKRGDVLFGRRGPRPLLDTV